MPGHNYPIMHRAYLDPVDYKNRVSLMGIYSSNNYEKGILVDLLINLDVDQIVVTRDQKYKIISAISSSNLFEYSVADIGFGYQVIDIRKM
jgi:hypothetical protein